MTPAASRTAGSGSGARGAAYIALASVLFAVMAMLAKRSTLRLPGQEVAFIRFAVGLVACAVAATRMRLRARNWTGLLLRGGLGGLAVSCYFLAIEHLPVGTATLLNYTAPVFTAFWAALFLAEPIGRQAVLALLVTTTGVALVIVGNRATAPPGSFGFGPWQLVGVASAVLSGAAIATIREVRKTDGSWEIFGAFCLIGAVITGVPTATHWVIPNPVEWGYLVATGLVSVAAQLLMTYSFRFVKAAVGGIVMQLTPVAAIVLGFLIYGEVAPALSVGGAAITLLGVSWGAWLAR